MDGLETRDGTAFEVALTKIQLMVQQKRIRTRDFFVDFDGPVFGFGNIPVNTFRRGLAKMLPSLRDFEISEIIKEYTQDVGAIDQYVNYKAFCIDAERRPMNLEQQPSAIVSSTEKVTTQLLQQTAAFSQSLKPNSVNLAAQARECIEFIISCNATRQDFEWFARDFDPHSRGHITPIQFEQVLSCGGVRLSPLQVRTLVSYFSTEGYGINYRAFFRALGYPGVDTERSKNPAMSKTWPTKTLSQPVSEQDADSVLERLQAQVVKSGRRLLEYFKDYDRSNCGRITQSQFRRALNISALGISDPDVVVLAEKYKAEDGRISYVALSNDVESAVVPTNLEQNPLASTQPLQPIADMKRRTQELLETSSVAGFIEDVMMNVSDIYRQRRPELTTHFQDFDRCATGCVTRMQFERVLTTAGFVLSAQEFKAIAAKFENKLGVHYRDFLKELKTRADEIQQQMSQAF